MTSGNPCVGAWIDARIGLEYGAEEKNSWPCYLSNLSQVSDTHWPS